MADEPEEEAGEQGPQPPMLQCPLHSCDKKVTISKIFTMELAAQHMDEHFAEHTHHEILETINTLHEALFEAHQVIGPMRARIQDQDSALRGAAQHVKRLMEEISRLGGAPMPPGSDPGPQQGSGLLLPPGVAEGLVVAREKKHGDVVEIHGEPRTLVGKRLSDADAKRMGLPTREDHRKKRGGK